jgi:hypothetical protein
MKYLILVLSVLLVPTFCFSDSTVNPKQPYKVATIISYTLEKYLDEKESRDKTPFIRNTLNSKGNLKFWFLNYSLLLSQEEINRRIDLLDKQVEKFNPDIILVYGVVAFEHYLSSKLYPRGYTNTIFYCIPDYYYRELALKYPYTKYKKLMNGTIIDYNFKFIKTFLAERDVVYKNIYVFRNSRSPDKNVISDIKEYFPSVEEVIVDTDEELKSKLESLQDKDVSILIFVGAYLKSVSNNRYMIDSEIADLIKHYNKKHIEISLLRNLAKYGVLSSYIILNTKDFLLDPEETCNKIFYRKYHKLDIPLSDQIGHLQPSLFLNNNRAKELKLDFILNKPEGIADVYY